MTSINSRFWITDWSEGDPHIATNSTVEFLTFDIALTQMM